jgi:hypothetical protein
MRLLLPRGRKGATIYASNLSPISPSFDPPFTFLRYVLQPHGSPFFLSFSSLGDGNGVVFTREGSRQRPPMALEKYPSDGWTDSIFRIMERNTHAFYNCKLESSAPTISTPSSMCHNKWLQRPYVTRNSSLQHVHSRGRQICFLTTFKNDKKDDNSSKTTIHANNSKQIQELMENTVETVCPIVESAEANLKRAADVVSLGDLVSVYGMVFLVFVIITLPFVAR